MRTEKTEYIETSTGRHLVRMEAQFWYRGQRFHGLVIDNALYDDPDDSFAAAAGIKSSLDEGLIAKVGFE